MNARTWSRPRLPVFTWDTGFGELQPLFDPACPTAIDFAGGEQAFGRSLAAYRFRSPQDGCFGFVSDGVYEYNPVRMGRFLVDDSSGRVVRFEIECDRLPSGFRVQKEKEAVTCDWVKIGDTAHWLPVAFEIEFLDSNGTQWRAEVEYRDHRHFEAATSVTFR